MREHLILIQTGTDVGCVRRTNTFIFILTDVVGKSK